MLTTAIYRTGLAAAVLQQARGALPEWTGWLALAILVSVFAVLAWWLFFSPLPPVVAQPRVSKAVLSTRRRVAVLMLLSGALATTGARWDKLWHRMYGGFGDDFLWPPHLLLYGALGLNAVFAALGLSTALRR